MGRKSSTRVRKQPSAKVNRWLAQLLVDLQFEDLEQLTIDDIARIVNKSKSTIYSYFTSKEEILKAACQTRTSSLLLGISQLAERELDNVERYKQLIEIFAEGTSDISINFLQSIRKNYQEAWVVINTFTDHFVRLMETHYSEGMQTGIYNNTSVELLGHLDKLFITQVVTNPTIFTDEKYTVSELIRDYLNLRLFGLLKR
ncbi:MAG: TetR/AcrR family transcriptional regulator [Bacteroidota bacterium]